MSATEAYFLALLGLGILFIIARIWLSHRPEEKLS